MFGLLIILDLVWKGFVFFCFNIGFKEFFILDLVVNGLVMLFIFMGLVWEFFSFVEKWLFISSFFFLGGVFMIFVLVVNGFIFLFVFLILEFFILFGFELE